MSDSKRFTKQSSAYATFRPEYPRSLFEFLSGKVKSNQLAWDCATGTGQAARSLSQYFDQVIATDISLSQINEASGEDNIIFKEASAEKSPLQSESVDLITIAQAIHWFDLDQFYKEVDRVLKPGGLISAWGYGFFKCREDLNAVFDHFSYEILKPYWSDRNWFLVDGYPGLKLPYTKLETPSVFLEVEWNFEQVKGYLKSWSAYQKFIDENHQDPFMRIEQDLKTIWGSPETKHSFKWDIHWLTSIK